MSRRERRVAHEPSLAVEQHDLDLYVLAGDDRCRRFPAGLRHFIAERDAFTLSMGKGLCGGVGGEDVRGKRGRPIARMDS